MYGVITCYCSHVLGYIWLRSTDPTNGSMESVVRRRDHYVYLAARCLGGRKSEYNLVARSRTSYICHGMVRFRHNP